jgi:hypothetical protein
VVAAAGGPLFGIMAARWVRFPGAGVLAAVVLLLPSWATAGAAVEATGRLYENPVALAVSSAMPYTMWMVTDYVDDIGEFIGIRAGSPVGHLLYTVALCGLAVWAAVIKNAVGDVRTRWTRIGWILGATAVVTYLWAWLG